jgi:Zn-finger nucleic acid-binding protein
VTECPFCDGQGIVCKARIVKLNLTIYICDECDTIWLDRKDIKETNCNRFEDFMEQNGLLPLWSELTNIQREC